MNRYYIFDWDGVFADSFEASVRAKFAMGNDTDLEEAREGTIRYASQLHNHTRNSSQEDIERSDRWTEQYAEFLMKEHIPLFTGFIQEVQKIENVRFAIVSSGPGIVLRKLLRDVPLDFTHVLAYEDHHSKEEKVEHICTDWGVDSTDVYYFTDAKTDVLELRDIMDSTKIIGCSWGYLGFDLLKEVLPEDQILKTFADIHNIGS
ncbi:HAD family hydrolase [Patescibacteria group bacterium]|nr:HAD family hydrolase [Patescibacteria group bacterium]